MASHFLSSPNPQARIHTQSKELNALDVPIPVATNGAIFGWSGGKKQTLHLWENTKKKKKTPVQSYFS